MNASLESVPLHRILLRVAAFLVGAGALIAGIYAALWLAWYLTSQPPSSVENIPVYPGAQNVAVEQPKPGEPTGRPSYEQVTQVLTFDTSDNEAAVLAFYNSILTNDGWWSTSAAGSGLSPGNKFEWIQAGLDGPTGLAYRLTIDYVPQADGTAHVTAKVIKFNPL